MTWHPKGKIPVGGRVIVELREEGDFGSVRMSTGGLVKARTPRAVERDLETLKHACQTRLNKFDDEAGQIRIEYDYEDAPEDSSEHKQKEA